MGDIRAVACRNRDSTGYNHKDHEGALSFSAMFKCTAADIPKILFKRANPSEDSDEQVVSSLLLVELVVFYIKTFRCRLPTEARCPDNLFWIIFIQFNVWHYSHLVPCDIRERLADALGCPHTG